MEKKKKNATPIPDVKQYHGLRYTTRECHAKSKGGVFSDGFGSRSLVIQKTFHTKSARTSTVACVGGVPTVLGRMLMYRGLL